MTINTLVKSGCALGGVFALFVSVASAQPKVPFDRESFVLPDLSTVPGSITFMPDKFDFADTGFKYDGEKWISLDLPEHEEASVTIETEVPAGSYTFVIDAAADKMGQSTFWIEVDDQKLPAKVASISMNDRTHERGHKLMWTEIDVKEGATFTIHAKTRVVEGRPHAHGSWARLLLLPHRMPSGMGGPPPMHRPPPPAPQAEESTSTE